jgi:hypothetical protein
VFNLQDMLKYQVQLPFECDSFQLLAAMSIDGEPCVLLETLGKGGQTGVYILHALTLEVMHSITYKEEVMEFHINFTGTKVFFATHLGWFFCEHLDCKCD